MPTSRLAQPRFQRRRAAIIGWMPLALLPSAAVLFANRLAPWEFMWTLAFAIFAGLKWQTWWTADVHGTASRSAAYLLAWPGMDADAFLDATRHPTKPFASEWLWASTKTVFASALLWAVARRIPGNLPLARGWVGMLGLVLLLHFGVFHLLALFWQSCGIDAQAIMSRPLASKSLSEFWGKRWNLGFRQLAFDIIFRPLHRRIGAVSASLLVFLASGLIHDLVISVPARGGYGLPTAYFLMQGFGVALERSSLGRSLGLQSGATAWLFLLVVAAGPAFWLFHPPFVLRVILPFMQSIRAL